MTKQNCYIEVDVKDGLPEDEVDVFCINKQDHWQSECFRVNGIWFNTWDDSEHIVECYPTHWLKKKEDVYVLTEPPQEWTSVKDRLPDIPCDVLAAKVNGKVFQMSYHAPFDTGKRIFQWWGFGKWVDQHSQITHWMLLPPPPLPSLPNN